VARVAAKMEDGSLQCNDMAAFKWVYTLTNFVAPAGPWKTPLLRVVIPAPESCDDGALSLTFHVYFYRAIFSHQYTRDI